MAGINLFTPRATGTTSITSGVASAAVALGNTASERQLRIKNVDTTNIAFVEFGVSTVAAIVPSGATPGSMPIGPGETAGISLPLSVTHAAAICTAGTPIVYFTPGNGV